MTQVNKLVIEWDKNLQLNKDKTEIIPFGLKEQLNHKDDKPDYRSGCSLELRSDEERPHQFSGFYIGFL